MGRLRIDDSRAGVTVEGSERAMFTSTGLPATLHCAADTLKTQSKIPIQNLNFHARRCGVTDSEVIPAMRTGEAVGGDTAYNQGPRHNCRHHRLICKGRCRVRGRVGFGGTAEQRTSAERRHLPNISPRFSRRELEPSRVKIGCCVMIRLYSGDFKVASTETATTEQIQLSPPTYAQMLGLLQ